jgi:hypothetical protein
MTPFGDRLRGWRKATKRRVRQLSKLRKKNKKKQKKQSFTRLLEHQQNKYPEVPLVEVRARVARFQQVLRDNHRLNVEQFHHRLFRISA